MSRPGYNRLWEWFGLSRASFAVMPRALMHEMPDEWQDKMAALLEEWSKTYSEQGDLPNPFVQGRDENGRIQVWPSWLTNYRHPDREQIAKLRGEA